jgi:hypothetical protein
VACAFGGGSGGGDDDGSGGSNDGGNNGSDDGGGSNGGYCTDPAKLVYTLEENKRFSKFDPATGTFTPIGNGYINCQTTTTNSAPYSMSLDRNAIAHVLFRNPFNASEPPQLFRVDTSSGTCTPTNWAEQLGIKLFVQAYSTDTMGGEDDRWYIAGGSSITSTTLTFAELDPTSFVATPRGSLVGPADISGNADAELWTYVATSNPPRIDKVDKATGASTMSIPLANLAGTPQTWAFARWGGDFWVFLKRGSDQATKIYQFDGTSGTLKNTTDTNLVGPTTRNVVGAAVSTCAPLILL